MLKTIRSVVRQMLARPPEPIIRSAEIEFPFRWSLTRGWDERPKLVVVGNNPSDADTRRDDPTMWVVMKFAYAWGYGGVEMLNIYPFITRDYSTFLAWRRDHDHAVRMMALNSAMIRGRMAAANIVMAAWGRLPFGDDAKLFVSDNPVNYHCFGVTNDGAPKHPMARGKSRIPDNQRPVPWRLAA